jgi:hypothetical protein
MHLAWGSNGTEKTPCLSNCAPNRKRKYRLRLKNGPNLGSAQALLPPSEKECHNDGEDPVPKSTVPKGEEVLAQLHSDEPMSLPFFPRLQLLQVCAITVCVGTTLSLQGLLPPKLGDKVRPKLPARIATVHRGFVPTLAGSLIKPVS